MDTANGVVKIGDLKFWALGDRVLIIEDEFKSGYECSECGGSGNTPCEGCGGTGRSKRMQMARCAVCEGKGAVMCPTCLGKGGLLVAPEISQRRPTTGEVISVGEKCVVLKPGQRVMYSNFAGYVVDLNRAGRNVAVRILHETEVLCAMEGQLLLKNFKGKTEIAEVSK